jgi:hypothetical protein
MVKFNYKWGLNKIKNHALYLRLYLFNTLEPFCYLLRRELTNGYYIY